MSHNAFYFQQMQRINEVKQLIEQDEVSESQILCMLMFIHYLMKGSKHRSYYYL